MLKLMIRERLRIKFWSSKRFTSLISWEGPSVRSSNASHLSLHREFSSGTSCHSKLILWSGSLCLTSSKRSMSTSFTVRRWSTSWASLRKNIYSWSLMLLSNSVSILWCYSEEHSMTWLMRQFRAKVNWMTMKSLQIYRRDSSSNRSSRRSIKRKGLQAMTSGERPHRRSTFCLSSSKICSLRVTRFWYFQKLKFCSTSSKKLWTREV